jgi:RNA polymerase-binding transcription factor DksA
MTSDATQQVNVLREQLLVLEQRLARLDDHQHNRAREPSKDEEDHAIELANEEVVEDLIPRTIQHIAAIKRALARLAAGEAFNCANCGKPISPRRLALVPEALTCARCA